MTDEVNNRFEFLFAEHLVSIRDYCGRRVDADRIDDATAEVFAIAWRKIDKVPLGAGALPWLYAVAYRVVFHHWRQAGRQNQLRSKVKIMIAREVGPDVAEIIVIKEEYRLACLAASRLRPIDQEILRLALWEEISHEGISQVLGIQRGAVKARLHRARLNLIKEYRRLNGAPAPIDLPEEGAAS